MLLKFLRGAARWQSSQRDGEKAAQSFDESWFRHQQGRWNDDAQQYKSRSETRTWWIPSPFTTSNFTIGVIMGIRLNELNLVTDFRWSAGENRTSLSNGQRGGSDPSRQEDHRKANGTTKDGRHSHRRVRNDSRPQQGITILQHWPT